MYFCKNKHNITNIRCTTLYIEMSKDREIERWLSYFYIKCCMSKKASRIL